MTSDKEYETANLGDFEPRHPGAMTAYLRQAVLHRIRDESRKTHRKPGREEAEATALLESYEATLGRLREGDRQAIVARVELKLAYREVPAILGKPTEDAAQMAVTRVLRRLAREMGRAAGVSREPAPVWDPAVLIVVAKGGSASA